MAEQWWEQCFQNIDKEQQPHKWGELFNLRFQFVICGSLVTRGWYHTTPWREIFTKIHWTDRPEIFTVWSKFPPATFKNVPIINVIPSITFPWGSTHPPLWGFLSENFVVLKFFGIFVANFGGKSPKLWYLLDFYSAFLKNIGSQPCSVAFRRKWGLSWKMIILVILTIFERLPQAQLFHSWHHFSQLARSRHPLYAEQRVRCEI